MMTVADTRVDLDELLARIRRQQEETRKFVAEAHKRAKGRKSGRDPWMLVIGAIVAGAAWRLPEIIHAFGGHP